MAKAKMIDLTTERPREATLAPASKPRVVRVRHLQEWSGRRHWYMDGWPLPVPAWTRHLDGWSVRGIVGAVLLALVCIGAGTAWALLRLAGRAR